MTTTSGWAPFIGRNGYIIGPNCLRDTFTGELNRKYLRVSAVYRLLKRKVIGKTRALELLAQKHTPKEMKNLRGTVELWRTGPIKDMLP